MTGGRQPPAAGVHLHGEASGQGRNYLLGQGTMNIYEAGGPAGPAAVVVPVVAQGVAASGVFVGRDGPVGELLGLLDPNREGPGTAVVSAVAGLAGVGKTALARHAAAIAVGRGWFPGGAVLVDLHGYNPAGRVEAVQTFGPLLRALGVAGEQIPPVPAEQAAAYHQLLTGLAERGRPVLLVLDNVSGPQQVADLLPVHRPHRVVVTSRHTLGDLPGTVVLELDVLPAAEAVELLAEILRERHPADRRVTDQPDQAEVLVGLCGRLPLAVQITAALLADDPALTLAELVGDLGDKSTRLAHLAYGERAVAAAFDLSWQHLTGRDEQAARLFRLLTVNPGPDTSTQAAAVLADQPPPEVRRQLRVLRHAHLIEPGTTPGRWRMHDLVGLYATQLAQAAPDERAAATGRLLDYYLTTATAADRHLQALPGKPVPDLFTSREQSLAWLDTERPNLTAAVGLAAETGRHTIVVDLSPALAAFFHWRRHLTDWITVATTAERAAHQLHDPRREATALHNLGLALAEVRRFDEAITAHQQAGVICRETGDRRGEGQTLGNRGIALAEVRRFDEAITAHQQAAAICRETGDRHRESAALNNLGLALRQVRRFEEAITAHQQDLVICGETGDRHRESAALNNLGLALRQVRRFEEAITAHEQAGVIFRETGDRHREGQTLGNLGGALAEVRRFDEAITAHQQAGVIFRETGDRHSEGQTLGNLGVALAGVRRFDEAITAHQQAATICRETGDRHSEGAALTNLGVALAEVRRFDEAITAYQQAATIYRETGDRHSEGQTLGNLGLALRDTGCIAEARQCWVQAAKAFVDSGSAEDVAAVRGLLDGTPAA